MLYYVKSDKIYKSLTINLNDKQFIKFDVNEIGEKKGNQKTPIVFEFASATKDTLTLKASYSQKGKKTNLEELLKEAKKAGFGLDEDALKKALSAFNKQSSFDFFINKNACEFLSRELDLWIYQYLFSQKNSFEQERIKQIADFKELALELIEFIAKFEDELVKIWTKPRFVLNSHYLISLNTLKEKGFDLEKIYKHKGFKAQKTHWQELGLKSDEGLFSNETLALDTRFFEDLKEELETLFDESELNGLLIKSENFQALNTLLPRFKGKIDLIYIDPPFNTENDEGFAYLDKFQDSTWLTLMQNRLELAKEFLSEQGSFYLHLDHNANYYGRLLLNEIFGKENFRNEIVWYYSNKMANSGNSFAKNTETIMFVSKTENYLFKRQKEPREKPVLLSKREGRDGKNMRARDENGNIIYEISNDRYVDTLWNIPIIGSTSSERIQSDFNLTQKPEALLARIIKASSCAGGG